MVENWGLPPPGVVCYDAPRRFAPSWSSKTMQRAGWGAPNMNTTNTGSCPVRPHLRGVRFRQGPKKLSRSAPPPIRRDTSRMMTLRPPGRLCYAEAVVRSGIAPRDASPAGNSTRFRPPPTGD